MSVSFVLRRTRAPERNERFVRYHSGLKSTDFWRVPYILGQDLDLRNWIRRLMISTCFLRSRLSTSAHGRSTVPGPKPGFKKALGTLSPAFPQCWWHVPARSHPPRKVRSRVVDADGASCREFRAVRGFARDNRWPPLRTNSTTQLLDAHGTRQGRQGNPSLSDGKTCGFSSRSRTSCPGSWEPRSCPASRRSINASPLRRGTSNLFPHRKDGDRPATGSQAFGKRLWTLRASFCQDPCAQILFSRF